MRRGWLWPGPLILALAISAAAARAQAPAAGTDRLIPLEVTVNGSPSGTWPMLERNGTLYAPAEAYEEWRVQLRPEAEAVLYRGGKYYALSAVPGYASKVDFSSQSLQLLFSPQAFAATRLARTLVSKPIIDPVLPSAFFNYDVNYSLLSGRGIASSHDLGMVGEAGLSTGLGVLTNSLSARNLTGGAANGSPRDWTRLETTFTRDFPDSHLTLRLGDTSTRGGLLGRNVFYGGIQLGTNFALTPGYVTQPLPVLAGMSSAASSVELYVNDVLRQVSSVPPGPFSLDNFPLITGGGEARLVVKDILGRETVIVQSFFSSVQLLAAGLNDWSVEAGAMRLDMGTASNHYGSRFASGVWRHGLNNKVTLEGRAELSSKLRTASAGVVAALPFELLGRVAFMGSRDRDFGTGREWLLGVERQWLRGNFGLQAQGATREFRQLGQGDNILPIKLQVAGNAAYATDIGTFGVGFAHSETFDAPKISTVSLNYTVALPRNSQLNLTYSRASGSSSGSAFGATLIIPLDSRTVTTASLQSRQRQHDFYAAVTRSPENNEGFGWRALAGMQQEQGRAEAGAYYLNRYGRTSADISVSPSQQAVRLGAAGGMVTTDGRLFFTRRIDESFGLVEIKGYPDVGVGLGANVHTRTNADGVALLPRMLPYQNNSVRLNAADLPISAEIDSIEKIAVPRLRSAVKVEFPVRTGRGALIKIVLDDGEPAPAGSTVRIERDTQDFYVARRGEAFVTGLQPTNRLRLTWKDRSCGFDVVLPPEKPDQIARLGPLACKGVPR